MIARWWWLNGENNSRRKLVIMESPHCVLRISLAQSSLISLLARALFTSGVQREQHHQKIAPVSQSINSGPSLVRLLGMSLCASMCIDLSTHFQSRFANFYPDFSTLLRWCGGMARIYYPQNCVFQPTAMHFFNNFWVYGQLYNCYITI